MGGGRNKCGIILMEEVVVEINTTLSKSRILLCALLIGKRWWLSNCNLFRLFLPNNGSRALD